MLELYMTKDIVRYDWQTGKHIDCGGSLRAIEPHDQCEALVSAYFDERRFAVRRWPSQCIVICGGCSNIGPAFPWEAQ